MIDLDKVKDFRVLFIGDAIFDRYVYVRTVGKAIKENALSSMKGSSEEFRGGVWAAAKHLEGFVSQIAVMTGHQAMINERLVDEVYLRKLHVTHEVIKNPVPQFDFSIKEFDLVIITDFGHGTMTKELIEKVSREARYLAVNAQTNATNFGFNLITKYPRADFVVIDELEARLAAHDKDSPIEDVIIKLGFRKIIVTRGTKGAVGFDGAFERQAALTDVVKDSMGAGDAFLSVTSPYACAGASMKDLIRIGNAAGAIKVQIVGHRESVTKDALRRYLNG